MTSKFVYQHASIKRVLSLVLVFALCTSLCGCFKSKEARAVEEQISSIGTVTLESNDVITAVEAAYEALPEEQKAEVTNYSNLVDARKQYVELVNKAAIDNVTKLIDALSDVSLTSKNQISNAEDAYTALTEEQKTAIKNYDKLTEAKAFYDRIYNVFFLIEQIGTVTKDSEAAIIAAETAYQDLSIEERIVITNVATLTAARTAFDAIPKEVALTMENVNDYFSFSNSHSTSKKEMYGFYGRKISGQVTAVPKTTLKGYDNVKISICVTISVGRPVDGSINAQETFKNEYYNMTITISGSDGTGSAWYSTDGHYISPHWYPSISVISTSVTAVSGTLIVE